MSSEIFQLRNRGQLSGPLLSAEVTWTLERSECLSSSQDGGMMEGESLLLVSGVSLMLPEYHTTKKTKSFWPQKMFVFKEYIRNSSSARSIEQRC